MPKDAYYFSHDAGARNDEKLLELRVKYDWWGYGLYFAIIEILRECSDYQYDSNAMAGLSLSLNVAIDKLKEFLNDCYDLKLLIEEDGVFFSKSLLERMALIDEKHKLRVEAGRKGGIAKALVKQCLTSKVKEKK